MHLRAGGDLPPTHRTAFLRFSRACLLHALACPRVLTASNINRDNGNDDIGVTRDVPPACRASSGSSRLPTSR